MLGRCHCSACGGLRKARHCPKQGKRASGRADWERGAPKKSPAPHTCGRRCTPGRSCTSTVRGGVCPCPYC